MKIKSFTFSPFQENTYLLFDDSKDCIIIDPGCYTVSEEKELFDFIENQSLSPKKIVNTHCHIDHVFGVNTVLNKYDIPFFYHQLEEEGLLRVPDYAPVYGLSVAPIPASGNYIDESDTVSFGNTELSIRFTPGHSAGSVCFIHEPSGNIIAGDVLFAGSIGRVDLPGGDYLTLMKSIDRELLSLPDHFNVHPGHGPSTTIGEERRSNPFVLDYLSKK